MHPIERLRSVARDRGAGPSLVVPEAAAALAALGHDPAGTVTACRRLVERHPQMGPVWWLAARVLCAAEPAAEAWAVAAAVESDPTPAALAAVLPEGASVVLVGWPEQAAEAVRRRGDVEAWVVDAGGASAGLVRRLRAAGVVAEDVPDSGVSAAVAGAGLVVLEAAALGPGGAVAAAGSRAAAAVARSAGVPVWLVAGVGRALPGPLWDALGARVEAGDARAWWRAEEVVPLALCDTVVGPDGPAAPAARAGRADCPVAPELLA